MGFLFQFQYGTIKSVKENEVPFWLTLFQFQYGTIKRKKRINIIIINSCFNSNMVRLKVILLINWVYIQGFNSNMVRLKEWMMQQRR